MESHGRAVLTIEIVRAIRAEYVKGSTTQGMPAIVRKYGVALATIRDVLNNTHWKE